MYNHLYWCCVWHVAFHWHVWHAVHNARLDRSLACSCALLHFCFYCTTAASCFGAGAVTNGPARCAWCTSILSVWHLCSCMPCQGQCFRSQIPGLDWHLHLVLYRLTTGAAAAAAVAAHTAHCWHHVSTTHETRLRSSMAGTSSGPIGGAHAMI
jgi:hypothetical protein